MATGRLGSADLSATTNTPVYGPVLANTFSVVTVNILNRNPSTTVNIRLAVSTGTSPGNAEWIEYDTTLAAKGVLERTGLILDETNGKYVVVYASGTGVSVNVFGIETTTV
jgi:hypothetical protein